MCLLAWLKALLAKLLAWLNSLRSKKATDLNIVIKSEPCTSKGTSAMSNKKATGSPVKCPCLKARTAKGAVMPAITITTVPASITLQPVDSSNNPVAIQPTDTVTSATLTSDSTSLAVAAGADNLHYTGTIPANTPVGSVANLSATLVGVLGGVSVNFTASIQVTVNVSPPTPVAVDLDIVIA